MEFEFEEKEQYSLEDVQALVSDFKSKAIQTIESKDLELTSLNTEVERVKELEEGNHLLQIKNLAISNGIDEDLFDLIVDPDIEVVKGKIDKLKSITKEKEIDILISAATIKKLLTPEAFRFRKIGEEKIRGKDISIELYSLD